MPHHSFIELHDNIIDHEMFCSWTSNDAAGVKPSDTKLSLLGALCYIGKAWTFDEIEEAFDEDTRSLLLTGDMVTPSFLPHFVGVPPVDPNSLPIASSTLSLLEALFDLNKCLLLLPSLVLETFLYALGFADVLCDSLSVCFDAETQSLLLSCSDTLESLTLVVCA